MIAKIWNYSGWINSTDPQEIKHEFKELLDKAGFEVLGFQEHHSKPNGYTCIWILAESHFAAHTFPEEGCTYIELSSCNEQKLYDFLTMLPDHFDLLVNDADGGRYPAQKAGILLDDNTEDQEGEEEAQEEDKKEPLLNEKEKPKRTKRK